MKRLIRPLGFAVAGVVVTLAQSAAPVMISPELHPDRSITFRFRAPEAKKVVLSCEAVPRLQPMEKGADGVWSFHTGPVAPDIYVYSFLVDGQRVLDPRNPFIKYNLFNTENQVHVPGPADLPWEINDVPHGVIHRHHYRSAVIGEERDVWIYTPPGYDPAARRSYPVLYLLHGFSDVEDTWVTVGRANDILDNLIARGLAEPMLIVMPRGYGNRAVIANGWDRSSSWVEISQDSIARYGESLAREIIPLVEQNYRVVPDAEHRAVAGLSMGGAQALTFGLNAPERFAWVAAFSSGLSGPSFDERFPHVTSDLNARLRLLWLGCGTDDGLITINRDLVAWLKAKKVRATWVETPGKHSFMVWRRYLADVLPLLFKPEGK